MTNGEEWGTAPDGETVHRVKIAGGGLTAQVMTWGAVVQDLRLEGHAPPLVLGFETFDPYPAQSPYFGAIAGRCANRMAHGRFELDGRTVQLDRNFLGRHHLHGGAKGFGKRVWEIEDRGGDHVVLRFVSPDGDMGYPGTLTARCTYRLADDGTLAVRLEAETDAPTICNLAQHSYFNLDDGGATDILDHVMQIEADSYLPVDDDMIPTGEVRPVAGTEYDFRQARPIRMERDGAQVLYDQNFCVSRERRPVRRIVTAAGARSGVTLETHSNEPGVQFYAGHKIAVTAPGLDGIAYQPRSGFCLEAQLWPDAPNHPDFPSVVLRPGERYLQETEYRFARA